MAKDDWNIKPNTQTKLQMLEDIFDIWLTIWNGSKQQKWVDKEWYVLDLFAGRGWYDDKGKEIKGSPLIFLEKILSQQNKLRKNNVKIKLFFVEKNKNNFSELEKRISKFKENYPQIKHVSAINLYREDCNKKTEAIIKQIVNNSRNPLFLCIDPWGINIKKETIKSYLNLFNPVDIFFNYSKEGERRTRGVAIKALKSQKEIKTTNSLEEFLGKEVDYKARKDLDLLQEYVKTLFIANMYNVVGFDMEYPTKRDVIYYLLFASKNKVITNKIVKEIYAKYKERTTGPNLFGKEFYLNSILSLFPKSTGILRKSLLYKTKVEYGDWTINHIIGCMHGCNFPCYAMRMAQKFGWVKDYDDWRKPKLVRNALELLDKEIHKYKNEIDFVHLCFMSDPFMYNCETNELMPEVKDLTLKIIERLNKESIRVTTLTKGYYPDEILDKQRFLSTNEYGITIVSLNNAFKKRFEPFSAKYDRRIKSLRKLSENGLRTWVSLEPYPTPELDKNAEDIERILEKISFVKKIIFGKLNYRRLNSSGISNSMWKNNIEFYANMAQKVIDFCQKNNIKYHIKSGTPLNRKNTENIFLT